VTCRREGFSLLEVIVAVVLLGIVLTTLAGLTFATARQAIGTGAMTQRQATSLELVNRFSTLPYDSLANYAAPHCDTTQAGANRFRRCVSTTSAGAMTTVQVTVTPLQHDTSPDVARLFRMMATPPANPLCTPTC
jgi:prepilin-type N-terminal cleavage/methylation domain-containing protein